MRKPGAHRTEGLELMGVAGWGRAVESIFSFALLATARGDIWN